MQYPNSSKTLCVLGSLNVDMTVSLPRMHMPGETITATDFKTFTGGKGGNQAVAAAKLGASVEMIGCVGRDAQGEWYLDTLDKLGIGRSGVETSEQATTGVALIEVEQNGENRIAVVPGANGLVDTDLVSRHMGLLDHCSICLMQLEVPIESVNHAAALLRKANKTIILDPAPARPLPDALLLLCDVVTPNETELAILTGMPTETAGQAIDAAASLLRRGVKAVLHKRGAEGAIWVTRDGARLFPGYKVEVVDTTAAGDAFNAGFATGLSMDFPLEDAIRLANAVGALTTTAMGAQGAMPSLIDALALVESQA